MTGLRILLATTGYPPGYSGSGGRLHQQYRRLSERMAGLSWHVVTKTAGGAKAAYPAGPTLIDDLSAQAAVSAMAECLWIRSLINDGLLDDVSLVHCAGWSWFSLLLCRAAQRRNIPVLRELTSVGDPGAMGGFGRYFIQWTNRAATRFVAISPRLQTDLRLTGISAPVWVRPNGIDVSKFRLPTNAERKEARAALQSHFAQLREKDRLILHIGRIRPLKNQRFLARCVSSLPETYKLLCIGPAYGPDDPYYLDLKRDLAHSGLAGRATVLEGFSQEVRPYYWAADVFAFPSTEEGQGNVMLEALCCGVPVAAHRMPGTTDWVVTPGVNGALSPIENVSFARALEQAANLTGRDKISRDARERFKEERLDEGYEALLTEMVAR